MDLSHITSQSLRRILTLTERKDQLVELVAELETEISKVLTGVVAPVAKITAPKAAPKASPVRKSKKRKGARKAAKSGSLKEKVLAVLESAGAGGLKIKEIAEKVGAPAANISVWFSTTGKKLTSKLEPGRYAAKGQKAAKPENKAPAAKSAAPKKVAKKGKKPSPLKDRILALLDNAGPKGMRVKDIAAKLGLPGGNVSVWISTTGKNLVAKVEPGIYAAKNAKPAPVSPAKAAPAKSPKPAKRKSAPKKAFKLPKAKGKN